MSSFEEERDRNVSAGGIVMIVIASIGVLTAITTILCLFITSKRRSHVNSRLESVTTRTSRGNSTEDSNNSNSNRNMRTVIPMFPDLNELAKNPPTYDEAIRLPSPVTPTEPQRPSLNQRSGTPPPAFDEVNVQNTANQANTVNESSTITINSNLKCNTSDVDLEQSVVNENIDESKDTCESTNLPVPK